jgi:hypothetical protein
MRIADKQLAVLYRRLERRFKADSTTKIEGETLLDILAAVGDRFQHVASAVRKELAAAKSPKQQLAIVRKGLTGEEAADLGHILDEGAVPMSASARNFIAAVLGREPLSNDPDPFVFTAGKEGLQVHGVVAPDVTVEAVNLSTAPLRPPQPGDTLVVGHSDAAGRFTGRLSGNLADTQEGDVIRLRTRDRNNTASDWITIRAHGLARQDTREAEVALQRIALIAGDAGTIDVTNLDASLPISEPMATLEFTNARSREKTRVTLNSDGAFDAALELAGRPGDRFSVAVSDGKTNVDFRKVAGSLVVPNAGTGAGRRVDLADPPPSKYGLGPGGAASLPLKRFSGPLFVGGITCDDPVQGQLPDCYFPTAMSALAKQCPEVIEKLIASNEDGTYRATFKDYDWRTRSYRDVTIVVDGDLYSRDGAPAYGCSKGDCAPAKMELWFPLLEKAYASWKGSYDEIGKGGAASDVFQACLGKTGWCETFGESDGRWLWEHLTDRLDKKLPVALGTYSEAGKKRYTNTGVYPDHAYTVLGYKDEAGKQMVQLRNPWGTEEPLVGGDEHGIFWMDIKDVCHLFENIYSVES